jgi:hypothetical protein
MKPISVKMSSATTTSHTRSAQSLVWKKCDFLTTKKAIAVTAYGHLREALAVGHDAQCNAKEKLEALQEIG